ncbi:MAG: TonB-dependent receptor [Bacteroidales bacterium]
MILRLILGLLCCQVAFMVSFAQQCDSTIRLPGIEISAERLDYFTAGQKITMFDSLTKSMNESLNLDQMLSRNTSLQINNYNYNGLSTISFRGTGAEHTGVYWNGFLLNTSNSGQVDFSLIPSGFFNDLRILYGGGSSLFGSGNMGGGIHLNSKPEFIKQVSGNAALSLGSFETYEGQSSVVIANKKWYSKTQFIGKVSQNDFSYENLYGEVEKQENAALRQYGFMQDLYKNIADKYILGIAFWYQFNDRETPSSIIQKPSDVSQTDESIRGKVSIDRMFKKGKLTIRSAWLYDYYLYHDPEMISSNVIDSKISTNKSHSEIQYDQKFWNNSRLSTGFSYIHEQGNSINWNGAVQQITYGFYALWSQLFPQIHWTVNVNLRQNFTEGYQVPFTPAIGFEGKIWRQLYGKLNLSRNFRVPTFNERFWIPGGNENLEPENAWNQEAGIYFKNDNSKKKLRYTLASTFYNSLVDNWIIWIPVDGYSVAENVREVWSRGVELDVNITYSLKSLIIEWNSGYTLSRSTNQTQLSSVDDSYQKQLRYVPEHRFYTNLSARYKSWLLSYNQNITGLRYTTSDNSEFLEAYSLGNLTAGKKMNIKKVSLYCQVDVLNLWDTEYQTIPFYPTPGRNYKVTLQIIF